MKVKTAYPNIVNKADARKNMSGGRKPDAEDQEQHLIQISQSAIKAILFLPSRHKSRSIDRERSCPKSAAKLPEMKINQQEKHSNYIEKATPNYHTDR
jgi:hypothetical protein